MIVKKLSANNIKELSTTLYNDFSLGIGGLSGSGKSTFCRTLYDESIRRLVTLLPKSEYRFVFSSCLVSNFSASAISDIPLVLYLKKNSSGSNPRSTVGTHTGLFKSIRYFFGSEFNIGSEFFSFNNSLSWCSKCKGRGSFSGSICPECFGGRYSDSVNSYKIRVHDGRELSISDANKLSVISLYELKNSFKLNEVDTKKIENFHKLGISYLSLDRVFSTLSGGETLRVFLAECLSVCDNSLIILDEISTGVDRDNLAKILNELSELSSTNQVWFIDHSDFVLNATQKNLFFGPGSGAQGGNIVDVSPRPKPEFPNRDKTTISAPIHFEDLSKRNIDIKSLELPSGCIIGITGESGCGKSTLVHECILPFITKKLKKFVPVVLGQDNNQSITSKSTVSTFLNIRRFLKKYTSLTENNTFLEYNEIAENDNNLKRIFTLVLDLGLGYLTLNRKIQTLSTGEFQCISLISRLLEFENENLFIILDEPSKGLSQNILNLFMSKICDIVNNYSVTILIIEHNEYILKCCDYIIDFGKRSQFPITSLNIISQSEWSKINLNSAAKQSKVFSGKQEHECGIVYIDNDVDTIFKSKINSFKGGILKYFSDTANWIYKDFYSDRITPVIAIDFEKTIYSKNTFLFEVASIINQILHSKNISNPLLDFYNTDNICQCCKGTGRIKTFNLDDFVINKNANFLDGIKNFDSGVVHPDIMNELKRYNLSKFKFFFNEIKKVNKNINLNKSYASYTDEELKTFLYGYWESTFYDTKKKTQRQWYGIIHLIRKYLKASKSELKDRINNSLFEIDCPYCNSTFINPIISKDCSIDIHKLFHTKIVEQQEIVGMSESLRGVLGIVGDNLTLATDVSLLPIHKQVALKCFEIMSASFYGYKIYFKNLLPYKNIVLSFLEDISKNNKVFMLDQLGISQAYDELLALFSAKFKLKADSYVYEIFGFKRVSTLINQVKKKYPCQFCSGKGYIRDESIFEGVDVTDTACTTCHETGISPEGLLQKILNLSVNDWLLGTLSCIKPELPNEISSITLFSRVRDLSRDQLYNLINNREKLNVNI